MRIRSAPSLILAAAAALCCGADPTSARLHDAHNAMHRSAQEDTTEPDAVINNEDVLDAEGGATGTGPSLIIAPGTTNPSGAASNSNVAQAIQSATGTGKTTPAKDPLLAMLEKNADMECEVTGIPPGCADIGLMGLSLFSELALLEKHSTTNVLISPLSIAQALALVTAGATTDSRCELELLEALGSSNHGGVPSLTASILHSAGGRVNNQGVAGSESGNGVTLSTASSIWTHSTIKATYEVQAEIIHKATARPLPKTYAPINEWAELASDGMIKDLFDSNEPLDPLTRAALVNVVSFKGMWTHQFDPTKTEEGVFYLPQTYDTFGKPREDKERQRTVQYMTDHRHVSFNPHHEKLGDATVIKLDYGTVKQDPERGWDLPQEFAALLLLPKDDTPESEEKMMTGLAETGMDEIMKGLFPREVNLQIPKFQMEFGTTSIKDVLRSSLGINEVFDGKNVLNELSDDPELHLDDVYHKAVMEVTEEGTTAAAATVGMVMTRSVPPPPLDLTFDRPFVMMVVHVKTGTPLFVGRVVDPVAYEMEGVV